MANNESVLKPSFLVLGGLGTLSSGWSVLHALDYMASFLGVILALFVVGSLVVSIGYLTVGLKYDEYIPRQVDKVEKLIMANIGLIIGSLVFTLIVTRFSVGALILPVVMIGFSAYMLKLVKE